ncbi:hypothetical protein ACOMHN_033477 [Nucella lapillus]
MEDENESEPEFKAPDFSIVDDTVGDPYCFESDHVALKNNPDYHKLLRTICLLEAQRAKAIDDMEVLYQAQEKVLEDPVSFVERLQKTGSLGIPLPGPQRIADLPAISWKKYTSSVDFASFGAHRQSARLKQHGNESAEAENLQQLKNSLEGGDGPGESTATEGFVRGRYKDESKSATFNKLWTPEEQKKLDELLIKYPPEEVEARRWRKIAQAFGDRTPQQIASRVQKYFLKLERNKLPVPGRVPNRVASRVKKASQTRQFSHQLTPRFDWMYRDSTFLQMYKPPVMMQEDGDDLAGCLPLLPPHADRSPTATPEGSLLEERLGAQEQSEDEDIPEELCYMTEYQELNQLRKLRKGKLGRLDPSYPLHNGFKCDRCCCQPIVGVRWHCVDCPSSTSLDFCETCVDNLGTFEMAGHNSSHRVRPVKRTWTKHTQDQDYMNFSNDKDTSTSYNYLDPNYMPAV